MIEVYFDGCCKPRNPGGYGGSGFVICNGKETIEGSHYIGFGPEITCNVAEHYAANKAMKKLLELNLQDQEIKFYGDSMLAVMQLAGKWKAKGGLYMPIFIDSLKLIKQFKNISFEWIDRDQNYHADYLSNLGADKKDFPQTVSRSTPTVQTHINMAENQCSGGSLGGQVCHGESCADKGSPTAHYTDVSKS